MSKISLRCSCTECQVELNVSSMDRHYQSIHLPKSHGNTCLQCNSPTTNLKFCSMSCSATYNNSRKDYTTFKPGPKPKPESKSSKNDYAEKHREGYRYNNGNPYTKINQCVVCGKFHQFNRSTCGKSCLKKYSSIQLVGKSGGWRNFGGNGKSGTYNGHIYQSSWELAWIVYHLDHGIEFIRPTEYFEYEFEGKIRKYYPDFYLINNNEYVEVKGFWSENTEAKINSVLDKGLKITVIGGNDITPYLEYYKTKAGVA